MRFPSAARLDRTLLLLPLLTAGPVAATSDDADGNVLVIVIDDLGQDWLAVYGLGTSPPSTPHIDALAADGVRFDNFWSNPMCSPTRAAIQTGRYSFRNGVGHLVSPDYALPLSEITLPEVLDAGSAGSYSHAFFGKWHLGNPSVGGLVAPNLAGWGYFAGNSVAAGLVPPAGFSSYFNWKKVTNGAVQTVTEYATTVTVDDTLGWITTTTAPWLCFASFNAVHAPFHAPPSQLHSVDLSSAGTPGDDPAPYYRAMIEALDTEIGRLLAGIDKSDTTVILLSDNGTPAVVTVPPFDPKHAKNSLHEGGINVPLIVRGPQVAIPGSSCDALVNATDLFATIAELTGVDLATTLPAGTVLDSVSLVPYLLDPTLPSIRSTVFAEHFFPNGPTQDVLAPPQIGLFCQPDLGFGGPGTTVLTLCGDPLTEYGLAELKLSGAPPFAPLFAAMGSVFAPTPLLGGTMVPFPPAIIFPAVTDAQGQAPFPPVFTPVAGPYDLYVQMAVLDPATPFGIAFSNAVKAEFLPWNAKAIRNSRYKLIADTHGGFYRFFDLDADPFEINDLLPAGLSAQAQTNYDALVAELSVLIAAP